MPEYSNKDVSILKAFGGAVRDKRKALGSISQEELADRAGVHRTYIGGVEQGRRNVSLLTIIKIAEALAVEPEDLFAAMPKPANSAGSTPGRSA